MLCSECGKNPATVHLMQSVNGVKTERHLCAECARKHPELQMSFANVGLGAFGAENLFQKFFNFGFGDMPFLGMPQQTSCPTCGESLADFRETGLLGCPDCYDTFSDQIIPVLQRSHGNTQHTGETPEAAKNEPAATDAEAEKRKQIYDLQEQLAKAVKEEDFEQAAKLRDEIKSLKGE